ncbi:hypothetical protein CODIS_40210 [Candidatus Thiodiazotropha endolucinida]|uniref:Uncharacterized protein n=1 Tax=Candidatus Thiodiazotropha endolucinida TaxID=1655433 RepID=A0A7Z1ADW2_9GAMM|nr:hypothetical protein CODIS_40210 [Candidatus Thiodiazotropha endolucinida]
MTKGPSAPLFYGLWNGRSVLHGQHQAALHDPRTKRVVATDNHLAWPGSWYKYIFYSVLIVGCTSNMDTIFT